MKLLLKIRKIIKNDLKLMLEKGLIRHMRRLEYIKYKDQRRINIYDTINLTTEQKRKIDELYVRNYGERIPYIWHQHFTAFTGNFDEKYFPELLYIPEFEHFMNRNKAAVDFLADKNALPIIAKAAGIETPKTIVSNTNGILRNGDNEIIDMKEANKILNEGETTYFIKPSIDSDSGRGCMLVDNIERELHISDIIYKLGKNFVVQERLVCSESIRLLNKSSVNTFRVMTYILDENIYVAPAIMRIGQNSSFLDNAHAGGMFIAVSSDGTLHEKAFTEFRNVFTKHPDSKVVFNNYKINNFDKVINAAKRIHAMVPQLGVVNWDFTINQQEEAVLIEANTIGGSIWLFEMAWGCGCFGDNTERVLQLIKNKKEQLS